MAKFWGELRGGLGVKRRLELLGPKQYSGWKIFVATWDYEGMSGKLRPLLVSPTAWGFGGGSPDGSSALIMDSVGPITLK